MYRGMQADYICYQLEKANLGQEYLTDVVYDVGCIWDDWYNLSYVTLSGYLQKENPNISDIIAAINDISGKAIHIAHQRDPEEVGVVLNDKRSVNQLWFKVIFGGRYVFAQCRFHTSTNYLEIAFGY